MPDKPKLDELLSQVAESSISHQLDKVEQIDIDVQTNIVKIFQGQVDKISLAGQGLVIQENLRVQEIELQTDSVAINPLSAIFGEIKLNQPVNAIARIVLTEADINSALTSDMISGLLQNLELNVDGEIVSFEPRHTQILLPGDGKIEIKGNVLLKETGDTRLLDYSLILIPRQPSQTPMVQSFHCTGGKGISVELIIACMEKVKELIKLPYFEWDDMVFNLKEMEVQKGNLLVVVEAHVRQIPSTSPIGAAA
jgi:hypothetical protein